SPFGVVDKSGGDPNVSGRTIHDLSFPDGLSINDLTDQASIERPEYVHCDAIASEILRVSATNPDTEVDIMAGDVAAAFRHISLHSNSVRWFAGLIDEADALILELAAPFGWPGSPGTYEIVGGAVSYVHGSHFNADNPDGFFHYHWVDDHINVTATVGSNRADMDRSLRFALLAVLGEGAINEDKFTPWAPVQTVLGLQFDTHSRTVSMPESKILKARRLVVAAFHSTAMSRTALRSLVGSGHLYPPGPTVPSTTTSARDLRSPF
ncbi:hypothetical protein PHYSODRAFT_477616, partial [Phytophthora sojae]